MQNDHDKKPAQQRPEPPEPREPNTGSPRPPSISPPDTDKSIDYGERQPGVLHSPEPWRNPWDNEPASEE